MQLTFHYGDEQIALTVEPEGDLRRVLLPDGTERRLRVRSLPDDILEIHIDEEARTFRIPFARTEHGIEFAFGGHAYAFEPAAARQAGRKRGPSSGALTAPMVGVVADVLVTEGQTVEAYQPLAVIEAMKVMATVEAPFAGTVQRVYVEKNQPVAHGAPVVDIAPIEAADSH